MDVVVSKEHPFSLLSYVLSATSMMFNSNITCSLAVLDIFWISSISIAADLIPGGHTIDHFGQSFAKCPTCSHVKHCLFALNSSLFS